MYQATLTKIRSNHSNLRTDVIEGVILDLPKVGERVTLLGEGLEFGTRAVWTTEIKSIEQMKNEYVFHTVNSTYKLEVGDKIETEKKDEE